MADDIDIDIRSKGAEYLAARLKQVTSGVKPSNLDTAEKELEDLRTEKLKDDSSVV